MPVIPSGGSFAFETPNIDPVFTKAPWSPSVAVGGVASARSDGVGTIATDLFLIKTVGANGGLLTELRFNPTASVAGTATTATVHRIFTSTKSAGATTAADTALLAEVNAPSQAAGHATIATATVVAAINKAIAAGLSILVSSHAANAANTGWQAQAFGGDY